MNILELKILDPRLDDQWPLPKYGTPGAAGLDLVACLDKPLKLGPNQTERVSSGVAVYIRDPGYVGLLVPRSGKGSKGLVLGNLSGIIDSDYTGAIQMCLWNRTDTEITVKPGDAVAQLLIVPVQQVGLVVVEAFSNETARGDKGFGSTDAA